nr:leucine-rich glioma-inactivated protein 1-like [Cherax quadricarinatus]
MLFFNRDLSHNQLTVVGRRTFRGAPNINNLQLDNNQLTCIDDVAIKNLNDLQVLTLNTNNLTTLPRELFERMTGLRSVRLADNPFICDCRLSWLGRWLRRHPTLALFTKCHAPATLRGKEVAELHDSDFRCPVCQQDVSYQFLPVCQ